jgi:transcriptional regulator with XRE-family HTH domain
VAPRSPDRGRSSAASTSGPKRARRDETTSAPGATLPEKIEHLFATVKPAAGLGREYTHPEIAERAAAAGHSISPSYVWQLRHNPDKNPTMQSVEALAAAFGVPVTYFFDDPDDALRDNLELLAALHDPAVRDLAIRAHGLSAETVAALATFADRAREWEGLGPPALTETDAPAERE